MLTEFAPKTPAVSLPSLQDFQDILGILLWRQNQAYPSPNIKRVDTLEERKSCTDLGSGVCLLPSESSIDVKTYERIQDTTCVCIKVQI